MVVQLSIVVGNVEDLLELGFSTIEVHQSIDQGNSYQEITSPAPSAATLDSLAAQTTFQMAGRELRLKIDGGSEQTIDFSTLVEFWTPTQVANRINEVVASLASVVGSQVRLTSPTTGRASSIEITYNDADDLGWAPSIVFGTSGRLVMTPSTVIYTFPDVAGSPDDRYKWRFSNAGANPISPFSDPVMGSMAPLADPSALAIGIATFLDGLGRARQVRLLVVVDSSPQASGNSFVVQGQPALVDSDASGFLQVVLVRGATVRIGIEGTSFVRQFEVPDETTFDLLTVMSDAPDQYTVQEVPPLLTRRSI